MNVADFDFALPAELIAQQAQERGASRLMTVDRISGAIADSTVSELPRWLREGDLMVANDTRVFPARLLGRRVPSGGAVECLLLSEERPASADSSRREGGTHGLDRQQQVWQALVHPGQKLKPGAIVQFDGPAGVLMAEILERQFFGRRRIRLWAEHSGQDVDALVDALGHVPLPPYIHRDDTPADRERYQTIFAAHRGSVAAPTAGLHFDETLLARLAAAGVERASVTLHVGYGTFKPVRSAIVEEHVVDPEPYEISNEAAARINSALDGGRRVIAVGTTTTRALEDAARRGNGRVQPGSAQAEIFIYPGFRFRVIAGLMTNFHLPQSSLLMLVAAFAGRERVLAAYRHAVGERYRFYSYGDAMLIV
jgi:S-adenosylmethionine:tRNA ribosyltransferase-isomerase